MKTVAFFLEEPSAEVIMAFPDISKLKNIVSPIVFQILPVCLKNSRRNDIGKLKVRGRSLEAWTPSAISHTVSMCFIAVFVK